MAVSSISAAPTNVLLSSPNPLKASAATPQSPPIAKAAADGDPPSVEAAESHTTKLSEKNHARVDKLV